MYMYIYIYVYIYILVLVLVKSARTCGTPAPGLCLGREVCRCQGGEKRSLRLPYTPPSWEEDSPAPLRRPNPPEVLNSSSPNR